jgi:hypothetical protein
MNRLVASLLTASLLATLTGCGMHLSSFSNGWSDADLKASTNIVQSAGFPTGLKSLTVDNRYGTIHILGTNAGTTGWTWNLAIRARTNAVVQQIAAGAGCQAELHGDQLSLVVTLPESKEPHRYQSDFAITVPAALAIRVGNHFGRIEIGDVAGDVEATDENGRLEIRNAAGRVSARTSFEALCVSNTGPATLHNQNGEIQARSIGGRLEATTCFASLLARDIRGAARLTNQNGSLTAENIRDGLDAQTCFDSLMARDIGSGARLQNQNGRIEAAGIGGPLTARTCFDSLAAHDVGGPAHLRNQNGSIKLARVRGDADIKTSFDRLSVEGIQGNAVLVNQNGRVVASGVSGSVKADTCFDAMEITGAGSQFVCHNQNGAIRLHATSATLAKVEAETSFDTLEVRLSTGLQPAIRAHTSFGSVHSDFPVMLNPPGGDPFAGAGPGPARITLQNQNGDIRIVRD